MEIKEKLKLRKQVETKSGKKWLELRGEETLWLLFVTLAGCDFTARGNKIMSEKLTPLSLKDGFRTITPKVWQKYRSSRKDLKWKMFAANRKPKPELDVPILGKLIPLIDSGLTGVPYNGEPWIRETLSNRKCPHCGKGIDIVSLYIIPKIRIEIPAKDDIKPEG